MIKEKQAFTKEYLRTLGAADILKLSCENGAFNMSKLAFLLSIITGNNSSDIYNNIAGHDISHLLYPHSQEFINLYPHQIPWTAGHPETQHIKVRSALKNTGQILAAYDKHELIKPELHTLAQNNAIFIDDKTENLIKIVDMLDGEVGGMSLVHIVQGSYNTNLEASWQKLPHIQHIQSLKELTGDTSYNNRPILTDLDGTLLNTDQYKILLINIINTYIKQL